MIKAHEKPAYNAWCAARHRSPLTACPNCGASMTTPEKFRKAYYGWWPSELDFAKDRFGKQFTHLPGGLESFFDFELYQDVLFEKEYFSCPVGTNRGVWVFRNI